MLRLVMPPTLNPDGLTCAPPTDPLELALWRVVTEGGRPDHSCGNAFVGYQRTLWGRNVPALDTFVATLVPTLF